MHPAEKLLTIMKFTRDFTRSLQATIIALWDEVADALGAAAGELRPNDRFGADVGAGYFTSEGLDQLFEVGSKRAAELGILIDFEEIETVDDYVRAFVRSR